MRIVGENTPRSMQCSLTKRETLTKTKASKEIHLRYKAKGVRSNCGPILSMLELALITIASAGPKRLPPEK